MVLVPGPVSNLSANPTQSSIVLTWSPPEEPNGIIISYEVIYEVNNSKLVSINTTNLSTTFTISRLTPVSNISVSAYTSVGRGIATSVGKLTVISPNICKNLNTYIIGYVSC